LRETDGNITFGTSANDKCNGFGIITIAINTPFTSFFLKNQIFLTNSISFGSGKVFDYSTTEYNRPKKDESQDLTLISHPLRNVPKKLLKN